MFSKTSPSFFFFHFISFIFPLKRRKKPPDDGLFLRPDCIHLGPKSESSSHSFSLHQTAPFLHPPVKIKFVGQHPPIISPRLRRIQTATQLLSDGDGDAEGVGSHQRGDVTGRVQQRCVNTLGILQGCTERLNKSVARCMYITISQN